MSSKSQWLFMAGLGLAFAGNMNAAERPVADGLPYNEIESASGARYVTGGIGIEAQERLNALADRFNMKLVFTLNEGNYLADVHVAVKDAQGRTVIEDIADGPFFMAQLPPGRYTVEATYNGKAVSQTLSVGRQGTRTAYFRWPSEPGTDFIPTSG